MRIYHNQLVNQLNQPLPPFVLVFGDEPWQKNDSLAQIKSAALHQGFDELIRFAIDDKFDWSELLSEYNAMSLFAARRVIELEFLSSKLNDKAQKAIAEIVEQPNPDTVLLFHGDKLDGATTNRKWFKSLNNLGFYVAIYDLDSKGMSLWLSKQLRHYQLTLDRQSQNLLTTLFEGNVLALDQELQKLSILYGNQPIDADTIESLVINQAKFNPFGLIDSMLSGKTAKCIAMLSQMEQEGTPVAKLIFFINKELQLLKQLFSNVAGGMPSDAAIKDAKIWDKRKPLYMNALQHSSIDNVYSALDRIAAVDFVSKTSSDFNSFQLLADVCLSLFHADQLQPFSLDYESQ
ncbi:DNA polymerase III subunit delta [Thalassotalea euphylliae]|uniref:DNA polymerase III subunit delta n=1 Tax=Thalassotalea euphylliae TaxID=1655234 RepID=UPI0036320B52